VRKTNLRGAAYEVIEHEAVLVAEMFRRYADDGASIADLARWMGGQGVPTRTGKHRWDRSVIWAMVRNPVTPDSIRRVTIARVIYCDGGVVSNAMRGTQRPPTSIRGCSSSTCRLTRQRPNTRSTRISRSLELMYVDLMPAIDRR
jgi:Recombinase